jgi:ribosomal protein L30E
MVVPDLKGNLPGRGAWVHVQRVCIETVQKQPKLLHRAFKGNVNSSDLLEHVETVLMKKILDSLSLAAASGSLAGGHEQILEAILQNKIRALVLANNIADRTRSRLLEKLNPSISVFELPITSAELGFRVGKGPRAALGILASAGARGLIYQLRRRHQLG